MEYLFGALVVADIPFLIVYFLLSFRTFRYPSRYAKRRSRFDSNWFPSSVAAFVPCKGCESGFESNVRHIVSLAAQELRFRVFFLVESELDPAWNVISRNLGENTALVETGVSTRCCQKNHSLLRGIAASSEEAEVYLFLDSDTSLSLSEIRELLLPLSDANVSATSGFQWNILTRGTLGERLHSFTLSLFYMTMSQPFLRAVWGGATAIRRSAFDAMNTKQAWATHIVDDLCLQSLLIAHRRNVVFVPTAINEKHQRITTVGAAIAWCKRQVTYCKFTRKGHWYGVVWISVYPALRLLLMPVLFSDAFLALGRGSVFALNGVFLMVLMVSSSMNKRRVQDGFGLGNWFLLTPLYVLLYALSVVAALFSNEMVWAGVHYLLDCRRGTLTVRRAAN